MKRFLVRYKTKPEKAEENAGLIANVFRELHAKAPEDVRYLVLKLDDGTFLHFVVDETADGRNPIPGLAGLSGVPKRDQGTLRRAAEISRGDRGRQLSDAGRVRRRGG